ncbi:MAG: ABC-F family ATP-binding cassette domain-containing protein [Acidobacteriaceae bacterium]
MPPILNAHNISKRFGAKPLFQGISFAVHDGDRIGLIGPNGAGKSTLLAMLAGEQESDTGEVAFRKRVRIGYVHQISDYAPGQTVRSAIEAAMVKAHVPENEREQRLRETLGRAGFVDVAGVGGPSMGADAASLSGGWRKRLAIAEALVVKPDILLLDEPTNHLDLEGIEWLEGLLSASNCAYIVVAHDRYFLENVAEEVVELNPMYKDGLLRVKGSYSKFLEDRELWMEAEQRAQEGLRNRVRIEVEWLRRGPKARATKAKARIDNANELIAKLADSESRSRVTTAGIAFDATNRQTKRLIEMDGVTVELGGRAIIRNVRFNLHNGMKLGLVGPNGSGKTTLLRAMTGELEPSAGKVLRAPTLRIVYFSQMREIDTSLTLRRALAPHSDSVIYQDTVVHVASYASRFLFTGEQLNQPVERLSGGERARVLIARLMLQPADVLILDEPTNDLDIPTLEILEEALLEFKGALVLVTHDRYLLDRVTNTVVGLDGRGNAELFADYLQWEEWRAAGGESQTEAPSAKPVRAAAPAASSKKKLSYIEQREYDGIEARVEAADARLEAARHRIDDPAVVVDAQALIEAIAELESAQEEHDAIYERWAALTAKLEG